MTSIDACSGMLDWPASRGPGFTLNGRHVPGEGCEAVCGDRAPRLHRSDFRFTRAHIFFSPKVVVLQSAQRWAVAVAVVGVAPRVVPGVGT